MLRCPLGRVREPLDRGELEWLGLRYIARCPIADEQLDGRGERRDRQRDRQRGALVAGPFSAQAPDRVDAGEQEAGDDVAGHIHVHQLVPEVAVAK
jgi:hypothetical protein